MRPCCMSNGPLCRNTRANMGIRFLRREMIEAFLRAPASSSAREVEHAHVVKITYVCVDDPLVAVNIDTPEQYAELPAPALPIT